MQGTQHKQMLIQIPLEFCLTKDAEYEVKLILHSRSREERSASDHFIKDAANTPGQNSTCNTSVGCDFLH